MLFKPLGLGSFITASTGKEREPFQSQAEEPLRTYGSDKTGAQAGRPQGEGGGAAAPVGTVGPKPTHGHAASQLRREEKAGLEVRNHCAGPRPPGQVHRGGGVRSIHGEVAELRRGAENNRICKGKTSRNTHTMFPQN